MELILLEKVLNLGNLGDRVKVKPGYGRNFLVPQGMAVPATKSNVEMFEERREELERAANEKLAAAKARRDALDGAKVEFTVNTSPEGKLYGSIGPREIADKLTEAGTAAEKSEVVMGEGPIRIIGTYQIPLQLHADVETEVTVVVASDDPSVVAPSAAVVAATESAVAVPDEVAEEVAEIEAAGGVAALMEEQAEAEAEQEAAEEEADNDSEEARDDA